MSRKGPRSFRIYGPGHFKYTWEKYLEICDRDGTSASKEIRQFVEGQVSKRDPGNPQTTLGTYVDGHEDQVAAKRSDVVKELIERAQKQDGYVRYREVLARFMDVEGNKRVVLTKSMCEDLKKLGVRVLY